MKKNKNSLKTAIFNELGKNEQWYYTTILGGINVAKFKVGDKVRAITENYYYTSKSRKWEGVVTRMDGNKFSAKTTGGIGCDYIPELISLPVKDFELIESKPTKNQRITALEKEVAELKAIVHELRKTSTVTEDVTTPVVENKPKTPNELRGEIIEKAKLFIEKHGEGFLFDSVKNSICAAKLEKFQDSLGYGACIGYSRCHRDDVFNEHIGKAIALGRALGLDVSEFEQAVQPNDIIEGMEIMFFNFIGNEHKSGVVTKYDEKNDDVFLTDEKLYSPLASKSGFCHKAKKDGFKILNDTNAIY